MKKLILLAAAVGLFFINFASADVQSLTMNFIVPTPDTEPPTFDNLRNFTNTVNTSFSGDFDATDDVAVECFGLNETSVFNIDCSGTITNVTALTTVTTYWLNVSVNDTSGNHNYGEFYIDVIASVGGVAQTCRYKKLGYYDTNLPWLWEANCV